MGQMRAQLPQPTQSGGGSLRGGATSRAGPRPAGHLPILDPRQSAALRVAHRAGERGLVAFDCRVREPSREAILVEGRLNVYIVDRWEDLMEQPEDGA